MRYAGQYVAVSILVVWAVVLYGCRSEPATAQGVEAVSIEPVRLGMLADVTDDLVSPGTLDRPDISSVWTPVVGITTRGVHLLYESADGDAMIVDGERWPPGSVMWDMPDLPVSDDGNHIAYASEHRISLEADFGGAVGAVTPKLIAQEEPLLVFIKDKRSSVR